MAPGTGASEQKEETPSTRHEREPAPAGAAQTDSALATRLTLGRLPADTGVRGDQEPGGTLPAASSQLPTSPTAPAPRAGAGLPSIPGYEVLSELGRGGMGVVYKARQTELKRLVALKMVLAHRVSADTLARFRAEAESVARLAHPNIIQIYEVGEHDGQPYFSLEYVEGGSLDRMIAGTPQPPRDSAWLVRLLALAMQAAHEKNVVHRDLKPANVLLAVASSQLSVVSKDQSPASPLTTDNWQLTTCPKVTDFGLAKQLDDESGQARSGSILGTPSYMAPEQAEGRTAELGPLVDVWALGAILYELLTGRPPFKGQTVWETLEQVRTQEPVPPRQLQPKVPRDLEIICLKCLRKRPGARYPSAQHLADDLQCFLDNRPILARPAGLGERLVKWARRSPFKAAALVAGAGFVAMLLAALYLRMEGAKKDALLAQQTAELQQRELQSRQEELDRGRRQEKVRKEFETLFASAEQASLGAGHTVEAWGKVERDARAAVRLAEADPDALADSSLLAPARRLLAQAEGELADARTRTAHRARLKRLQELHGDAVFFCTLFTGLELQDNLDRARRAVADGLALFRVTPRNDGPPDVDARFFDARETRLITDTSYELLLIDAEVLARPKVGEKAGVWRERLRQALALLDRADRLLPGPRTRSGLARRAEVLGALKETEAAQRARRESEATAPRLAADHFLLGMGHYQREEFREAQQPLATTLALQPEHYGAEYLLAVCRLQLKNYQEAREGLTRCLERRPDFSWPLLLRGYASMEQRRYEDARADFDAVLNRPPDATASYVALVNRGVLAMYRKDWSAAVADLKRAIDLRPDALAAYINLALTYRQRAEMPPGANATGLATPGANATGLAWQSHALLLGPAGAFSLLAVEAHRRQAWLDAVAVLDEAVRRQPATARLFHERGRLHLLLDDLPRARADFARAVLLSANSGSASILVNDLVELGRLLQRKKEHAEAVRAYQAALKLQPDRVLAHRLVAEPLLALGRYREAGEALDRYLQTIPLPADRAPPPEEAGKLADALRARGLIHVQQKDFRAAIDRYTQGLQVRRDASTLALRGWAHLMFNAPGLALPDFDEAIKRRPDSGDAFLGRADARVKLGKVPAALADAEAGVKLGPPTPRTFYNAARVHAQAVARLAELPPGQQPDALLASRCEDRAVELLRQALARVPPRERAAFWRDHVEADSAFNAIRRGTGLGALAATYNR